MTLCRFLIARVQSFGEFLCLASDSTISLEPLFSCFNAAQASSFTEPMPRRDSSVSLAVSQDASSSNPERMMDPVAPIRSWHQVILDLSVSTSPSWKCCSSSANQSDNTCCQWSYLLMWFTIEFELFVFRFDTPIVSFPN